MKMSVFFTVILLAVSSGNTFGSVVQWAANGHYYEAVSVSDPQGISWTEAYASANAQGGYLATATSESENDFIFDLINSQNFWYTDSYGNYLGPWLGAQYVGDTGTIDAVTWQWVTGEAWAYTNFEYGEPNNADLDELYLNYFVLNGTDNNYQPTWNNMHNNWPLEATSGNVEVLGYIIEWEVNPVPVPPAIWLFVSGLFGIFVTGRKARNR